MNWLIWHIEKRINRLVFGGSFFEFYEIWLVGFFVAIYSMLIGYGFLSTIMLLVLFSSLDYKK